MVTRKEKRSNCSSMSIQSQGQEARNYAHKLAEALYEIQRYINVYSTHRPAMQKCLDQLRNTEIILMEFHQHFAIASNMAATERSSKGKNSFAELAWVLISQGATGTLMKSIEMVIPEVSAARQRSVPLDRRQLETVVGAFLQELMDVTYALQYLRRKMEHLKKCHYSTPKGQARGQDDSRASLVIPLTGRVAGALESSRKAEEKLNRFPSRLARYFTSSDKIKENSMMNLVILVSDVAGEMKSVQDELCGIQYNLESCNVYIGGLSL
nr:PREDICTED: uncharacterized protein LOC107077263 [Lepisosteus oculatus]